MMIGGTFEDGFVTGVFSYGFNDAVHKYQNGQITTTKSRTVSLNEAGDWKTMGSVGDALASMMQGSRVPWLKVSGNVLDATDALAIQSRAITTGQTKITDVYIHNTLYDASDPNPNNWVEIPGFRSEGKYSHSNSETLWNYTGMEYRVCLSGSGSGTRCSPVW